MKNYREVDQYVADIKERQQQKREVKPITPEMVYEKAIERYGAIHQIIKAIEEMSELTKELCKALDLEVNIEHLTEEIADVSIMIDQLMMIYDCEREVTEWRGKKIVRLLDRLEGKDE